MEMKNFLRVTFILLTLVVCGLTETSKKSQLDGPGPGPGPIGNPPGAMVR